MARWMRLARTAFDTLRCAFSTLADIVASYAACRTSDAKASKWESGTRRYLSLHFHVAMYPDAQFTAQSLPRTIQLDRRRMDSLQYPLALRGAQDRNRVEHPRSFEFDNSSQTYLKFRDQSI
jgi:hypothetical protein